jgi:quinol monooxygenase YgiN
MQRRTFTLATASLAAAQSQEKSKPMYGLIGKMLAPPGQRDTLIQYLLEGTSDMPGCLSYIVSKDALEENAIWITEVWDTKESHDASLQLPAIKATIAKARPLIAGFEKGTATIPIGGQGLPSSQK